MLRIGEIAELEWSSVDLQAATARVGSSKTNEPRSVPLSPGALELLRGLPRHLGSDRVFLYRGKPLLRYRASGSKLATYWPAWKRAALEAGVTEGFHITRHTFASEYVMRGGNVYDLCKICGWTNYRMVEKTYGHLAPDYLKKAIAIMEGVA